VQRNKDLAKKVLEEALDKDRVSHIVRVQCRFIFSFDLLFWNRSVQFLFSVWHCWLDHVTCKIVPKM